MVEQEAVPKATAVRSPLPVMSSILPCPPCLLCGGVQQGGGGFGRGRGKGQGTFHPPCHILHCHMVLHPKGTSHNDWFGETNDHFQARGLALPIGRALILPPLPMWEYMELLKKVGLGKLLET